MIEDTNPDHLPPRKLILELFFDFEGKNHYRVIHKDTGQFKESVDVRAAHDAVSAG